MNDTNKQYVLDEIIAVIKKNLESVKQHKGAIHELNTIIELSKVYQRLNNVEVKEKPKTMREVLESLEYLDLK